jgi:hypothetical protein
MGKQLSNGVNKSKWLKIGICILGVLMIAGAITYTVLTHQTSASSASSTPPAATGASNSTQSSAGVEGLNWVKNVNAKFADKDFLFVLLPGTPDMTQKTEQTLSSAIEKIVQDGVRVGVFTLEPKDPELNMTAERLSISNLPAVLLFTAQGRGAIITGDITETKLLQAYLTLLQTCVPGNSGCCPK